MTILQANIPEAGYGKKIVLRNISFTASEGEIVGLIGPNVAGKSTVLKVLIGLLKAKGCQVIFGSTDITSRSVEENVRGGISFVPQGNRVFGELTVRENIEMGGISSGTRRTWGFALSRCFSCFPILENA